MSRITILILFYLFTNLGFSQIGSHNVFKNDWEKYNLKGNVRSIKLALKNVDETSDHEKIITEYNPALYNNDFKNGYTQIFSFQEFNKFGLMFKHSSQQISGLNEEIKEKYTSLFKIDSIDFVNKQELLKKYNFPLEIRTNKVEIFRDDNSKTTEEYRYKIDNQKITEELYFENYVYKDSKEETGIKNFDQKKIYFYNDLGQVYKTKIITPGDDSPYTNETQTLYDQEFGKNGTFDINYSYNENNQLVKMNAYRRINFIYQETYKMENNKIVEMEKLVDSEETHDDFDTNRVLYKYDEFGNVINTTYYDNEIGETIIHTIKFDYTFDDKNNWITCKMYIDSKTDKPNAFMERKIEYYKD